MKRFSFALVAALALVVNACEKHTAAETASSLEGEKAETANEGAGHSRNSGEPKPGSTTFSPEGVHTNPAGAAPADAHDPAKDHGTGGSKEPGAVKYFPKEEKK